jgi:hypothetical protein
LWFVFALWVGLYAFYSFPPSSKEHPRGVTLIISRDEWEPMFNSPDYVAPERHSAEKRGSIGFGSAPKPKRPLRIRTIVELPYIDWAYKQSLKPQGTE